MTANGSRSFDPIETFPVDWEAMRAFFAGETVGHVAHGYLGTPEQAVTIEYADRRPGNPPRPVARTGWRSWWDRITGKREAALAEWRAEYQRWVDAGRPDKEVLIRNYIPNATMESVPEHDGYGLTFTVAPPPPADTRWFMHVSEPT